MIGLLVACLVNIISVKGNSLKASTVYERPYLSEIVKMNAKADDDRNKIKRDENKQARKAKAKFRKLYKKDRKKARIEARDYRKNEGDRVSSRHRQMVETRSVGGM
jgi:hypothetical protein